MFSLLCQKRTLYCSALLSSSTPLTPADRANLEFTAFSVNHRHNLINFRNAQIIILNNFHINILIFFGIEIFFVSFKEEFISFNRKMLQIIILSYISYRMK